MDAEMKRLKAAEASARWRAAHPERAREVERAAYHRNKGDVPSRTKFATDAERKAAHVQACLRWQVRNRDKVKENRKRFYDRHADKIRAKAVAWYYANKDKSLARLRVQQLRKRYGLTPAEYEALGPCCAICGVTEEKSGRQLPVDHDHVTGKVRGKLCHNCNLGLGAFRDDPALLRKAIEYIGA